MFQRMVRQQVAEHVLLKCSPGHARAARAAAHFGGAAGVIVAAAAIVSRTAAARQARSDRSLPRVSRLNSSARTNATATPRSQAISGLLARTDEYSANFCVGA